MMRRIVFAIFFTLYLFGAINTAQSAPITESDWQAAFNNKVTHGKMEVEIATGRIDILTDTHAIEVDYVRNYGAAIKQALQYAQETKKRPGLALIITDNKQDTPQRLKAAKKLSEKAGVTFWLINDYVSVSDLTKESEQQYWLNTQTMVRHNHRCRWFNNTKNGRPCGPDEGQPCGTCGG